MSRRAILTAVAATVALLQAPTPLRAQVEPLEDKIYFSITASDGGVVQCLGPVRESGCRNFAGSGTTTSFYDALISPFWVSPSGPWRCDVLTGPPFLFGCPDPIAGQVWFCLPPKLPGVPTPSVRLSYSNGVLSVNQPLREENKPCQVGARSFLGQDGEDAVVAAARRSRRSAADNDDVDTFDLEAEAGETVDVTLAINGSVGGIGEVATLRVLSGSGEAVLGEETGPLPLTLQATLDGPASIVVQTAKRGEEVPFMGYYTLDVAPAAGDSDELLQFAPIFLLVPRGDVEQ